ncbi:Fur family transcriptional regulator [Streptomyces sp. NPDC026673]|uniref:Fur family transcriptional regulator n=1 Tax=Streptomyces sp. NPDC026673 TaxID=3155724 RepID=UPI0033E24706
MNPTAATRDAWNVNRPGGREASVLRECGLRCTQPRLHLLALLRGHDGHLSANQIRRHMAEQGVPVNITTVYRTLETLTERGVVSMTHGPSTTVYCLTRSPHHHAVCSTCGSVTRMHADRLAAAVLAAEEATGFRLDATDGLILRGLCPECREDGAGRGRRIAGWKDDHPAERTAPDTAGTTPPKADGPTPPGNMLVH